jgi:hypothetical protein
MKLQLIFITVFTKADLFWGYRIHFTFQTLLVGGLFC